MNTRSALFEHCAMMVRLQSDMAQQFGSLPAPISPTSALPDQAIDGSQQHKANGFAEVFNSVPFVSQNTGD